MIKNLKLQKLLTENLEKLFKNILQSEVFQDKNILKFHVDWEHYELVYNRTTGNRAILLNLITSIVFTNEHF